MTRTPARMLSLLICVSAMATVSYAEAHKFALGLIYPGIGFRYNAGPRLGLEARIQSEPGISLLGARGYYTMGRKAGIDLFSGAGIHSISFQGNVSKGAGVAIEAFAGGEYFIRDSLSLQMDAGIALISLSDSGRSVSDSGAELTYGLAVNWYFGTGLEQ